LNEVPSAGDIYYTVDSNKEARNIIGEKLEKEKESANTPSGSLTLESMFDQFQAGQVRELRLIVKADVQGSLEPIISSLEDISANDKEGTIKVKVLHSGTGNITENDISLAVASKAIVMGFNVTTDNAASILADHEGIEVRNYNIIYRLIEDVEKALKGMLEPEEREVVVGQAEVRAVFRIRKLGNIAGCRVTKGELRRNGFMRVLRNGKEIYKDEIVSLKHEIEDVKEVREGYECGVGIKGFSDYKEGDVLECFVKEMVKAV
jgi:translation initiation factor IF-2